MSGGPPKLKVYAFGKFEIEIEGRKVEAKDWKFKKALQTFKLLLINTGTFVNAEELVDNFWPEIPPDAAKRNLYAAIYYIRDILEPQREGGSCYIESMRGKYRFAPRTSYWYDAENFERTIKEAQSKKGEGAISLYREALALYRGNFMEEDPYEDWAIAKREYYKAMRISALASLARLLMERGEYEEVRSLLLSFLLIDPLHEELQRLLMEAAIAAGKYNEAVMSYLRFSEILNDELGLDPEPETSHLYIRALNGCDVPPQSSSPPRREERKGEKALICSRESFASIYEFKLRDLERAHEPFMVGSLTFPQGEEGLPQLMEALSYHFRKGDVFSADVKGMSIDFLFSRVNESASSLLVQRLKRAVAGLLKQRKVNFDISYRIVDRPA